MAAPDEIGVGVVGVVIVLELLVVVERSLLLLIPCSLTVAEMASEAIYSAGCLTPISKDEIPTLMVFPANRITRAVTTLL